MLLSAVSVLVVAQSSSEIPEGLMNNPVHSVADGMVERDSISCISLNILWALGVSCKCIPSDKRVITRAGLLTHLYALHVVLIAQRTISGRNVHCNKPSLVAGKVTELTVRSVLC